MEREREKKLTQAQCNTAELSDTFKQNFGVALYHDNSLIKKQFLNFSLKNARILLLFFSGADQAKTI